MKEYRFRRCDVARFKLMKMFQTQSQEHSLTRDVHNVAPVPPGEILIVRHDIGRHNTTGKVIGEALYRQFGFFDRLPLTNGRLSSETLARDLRCRMPVIAAAGAPGSRMSKYGGEERIC